MIPPTVRPINMTDPFTEVTSREETDGDISRLGKSLDPEVELEEERNRASEDVKSKEMIENISSWKSRYFTVLGFFLVFLAIFLVVIVLLIYKIRKSKVSKWFAGPQLSIFICSESELFTAIKSRGYCEGGRKREGGLLQCAGGGGGHGGQTAPDSRHPAGPVIPVLERIRPPVILSLYVASSGTISTNCIYSPSQSFKRIY